MVHNMRRRMAVLAVTVAVIIPGLIGCSSENNDNDNKNSEITDKNTATSSKFDIEVNYSDKEKLAVTKDQLGSYSNVIKLSDETVTISQSGDYVLEGIISDGQIIVDVPDTDTGVVSLILNDVEVSCSDSAALYVKNAEKVVLSLVDGTTNTFKDGENYVYDDEVEEEPNACIFSKDDLVISGKGEIVVNGNFNNGIASKDDLTITGGNIKVSAVNNGIKGKDSIAILNSDIMVEAGADGLKADNATEEQQGYIIIENGNFDITSGEDGFQAENCMVINGGEFKVVTGEGATTTSWNNGNDWGRPGMSGNETQSEETTSIKAFKAGCDITINGGDFEIESEDDAIHTNVSVTINDGSFEIASGDDGIHADNTLEINGGVINITQCYEGIESTDIIVNDGDIHVVSGDDGFNAAGGNDSSAVGGRPGMNNFGGTTGSLTYNGGYIYVNASGDGLDANGQLTINGGYIIVDGPANGGNGAFDYDAGCSVTGGFVVAAGYSTMAQMPNDASINCVMIGLSQAMTAGELINISDSSGASVITFSSAKAYDNLVLCTLDLKTGETYTVNVGGEISGDIVDGIGNGNYSDGTEYTTFTIQNTLTTVGNVTGGMGGMGGGRPGMNGQSPDMGGGRPGMDGQNPDHGAQPELPEGMTMPEDDRVY